MSSLGETLEVLSVNCRGMQDRNKNADVIEYLKKIKSNIYCLQDTHWTDKDYNYLKTIWGDEIYLSGTKTNARGVAILIRNNFEFKIINVHKDVNGNYLLLDILISNEFNLKIITIYAPNQDNPGFFENLENLINQTQQADYIIIAGDFNLTLNQSLDSFNYVNLNNRRARTRTLKLIEDNNLIDSYRYLNPTTNAPLTHTRSSHDPLPDRSKKHKKQKNH